ncbi:MAG: ABC transporter substrate-binding protein, partial [Nannocystaceae bacterium]
MISRRNLVPGALGFLCICIFSTTPGCNKPAATKHGSGSTIQLVLNWFPEAEHGGFYAAAVHGYYAEEGLNVEIVPGRPDAPADPQVATGRVAFGVSNAAGVLLARAQQAPLVGVMAPLQESPRCILVHEESGIEQLADLTNLTLAMGAKEPFAAILRRRTAMTNVDVVPYSGNLAAFLVNPNMAQQAFVFSEPFVAKTRGAKVRCLMVSELGYNPYASLLITSESMIANNPEVVEKMVRASVRGWEHYLRDPGPSHQKIHQQNPEMGLDVLNYGAEALKPLVHGGEASKLGLGAMTQARWKSLYDQLSEAGLLDAGKVDPSQA